MISKQDRVKARTVEDLERKYNFKKQFESQQQQQSAKGEDGLTPYIGANGNWWIGTADTGVSASGVKVSFTPSATEGIKVGTLTIGDISTDLFVPFSVLDENGEHYIKVGETVLTESILRSLIALLQ